MPSLKVLPYSIMEGEWENFRFRRIQPKDHEAVFEHIAENFCKDEPTCKLLGNRKALAADFNKVVAKMLKDDISFLAEDKETGEVAGVRVTFHHTKDTTFDGIQLDSLEMRLLLKLVEEVETMAKVEESVGITEWAEFFVASTAEKYRKLGLAGEFYRRSIEFLKASGFAHALVLVSSPFTRAATLRKGFVDLSRLNYENFKGFDGKPVFKKEQLTPEHFACVRVKVL